MVKSLVDKFRKVRGKSALCLVVAVVSAIVSACQIPGKPYTSPTAKVTELSADPLAGEPPLNSTIHLKGENGKGYEVNVDEGNDGTIDYTKTESTSGAIDVNFSYCFNKPSTVYAKVFGPSGSLDQKSLEINVIENPVKDYVDISGTVVDGETGSPSKAMVKVLDPTETSVLKEGKTDSNGRFSFTLDKLVSELPNGVVIKAREVDSDNSTWEEGTSFVNKINLSAGDHINDSSTSAINVEPYDNPNESYDDTLIRTSKNPTGLITPEEFQAHIADINKSTELYGFDLDNLHKGGIEVMKNNRNPNEGSFSDSYLTDIKNKILKDFIARFGGENRGGELYYKGDKVNISLVDSAHIGAENWMVYEPYSDLGTVYGSPIYGQTEHYPEGGMINNSLLNNGALIKILSNPDIPSNLLDYVRMHEEWHAYNVARGEANAPGHLVYPLTDMEAMIPSFIFNGNVVPVLGIADLRAGRFIIKNSGKNLVNVLGVN